MGHRVFEVPDGCAIAPEGAPDSGGDTGALVKDFPGVLVVAGMAGGWPFVIVTSLFVSIIQPIDHSMAPWDERRQALHAKVAETLIVRARWIGSKSCGRQQDWK